MAAQAQSEFVVVSQTSAQSSELAAREREKSLMLRAWIVAGLFFMALPGTLLGFSNLLAISVHRGSAFLPAAWMEGHGHAQVFGWIGSFILGIGFHSQPARERNVLRVPLACFVLWTSGVALRWFANIYEWHWRLLVPLSAGLELLAMLLFLSAAMHHKRPEQDVEKRKKPGMELWMVAVLMSTVGLTAAIVFNLVVCVRLALAAGMPSFPRELDQRYLVLLGWGFLAPAVWGFSARWLPVFLGLPPLRQRSFGMALLLDAAGVLAAETGAVKAAVLLIVAGAVACVVGLRLFERPRAAAKTLGVHPSFPLFARLPYAWLMIAGVMSVWAAWADVHGGIWGASRHALTVGFAATMVFAIGPRILPHFGGVECLFSTRLMLVSLVLLQTGCTLRVSSEPLAYEGMSGFAWNILPVSGVLELGGVLVFAANVGLTYAAGRPVFARRRAVV